MSRFQLKIIYQTPGRSQTIIFLKNHNQLYINAKMTIRLELSDKDFKAAIIKMLQWAFMNMLETNEKNRKTQQGSVLYKEQNENKITDKLNFKNLKGWVQWQNEENKINNK